MPMAGHFIKVARGASGLSSARAGHLITGSLWFDASAGHFIRGSSEKALRVVGVSSGAVVTRTSMNRLSKSVGKPPEAIF